MRAFSNWLKRLHMKASIGGNVKGLFWVNSGNSGNFQILENPIFDNNLQDAPKILVQNQGQNILGGLI